MNSRREVSPELLPKGETDTVAEAAKHPGMVNGFNHWSSPGWDESTKTMLSILTFDPSCPRCRFQDDWRGWEAGNVKRKSIEREPTPRQYRLAEIDLALSAAPYIFPCGNCGWPVLSGYHCNTCGDTDPSTTVEERVVERLKSDIYKEGNG